MDRHIPEDARPMHTALICDNLSFDRTLNNLAFKCNFGHDALKQIADSIAGCPLQLNHNAGALGTIGYAKVGQLPPPDNLGAIDREIIRRHGGYYAVICSIRCSPRVEALLNNFDGGFSVGTDGGLDWVSTGQTMEIRSYQCAEVSASLTPAIGRTRMIKMTTKPPTLEETIAKLERVVRPPQRQQQQQHFQPQITIQVPGGLYGYNARSLQRVYG
jgi:hypothetical protein